MTTSLADPFALTGTILENQYRADAVVGEGGFGVVYRGRHLSLDQPIAIKVLKGLDGGDARINQLVLEKFRAEARLLYTLSQTSLHIVRSLDFGATTTPSGVWAPFMILEWLEGRSLGQDIEARRAQGMRGRSLSETLAILDPVLDGLAVAHRKHVAHRDIKPPNIFLLSSGAPSVKVLDFGIAKIMQEGESAGTKGTFASFTWLYAAPEQLDPRVGTTGLATDVYAVGLMLTELLTDRPPVDDRDVVGIMRTALNPTHRPTPRNRGANVPDAIEAVCQRALAVDPNARYASVVELAEALATARGVRAVTTMQPASLPSHAISGPMQPLPSFLMAESQRLSTPMGPPPGTRPPGMQMPLPMSTPFYARPSAPSMMGPPPGTRPPGTVMRPIGTPDTGRFVIPLTIIIFVIALFLAGTCAAIHGIIG